MAQNEYSLKKSFINVLSWSLRIGNIWRFPYLAYETKGVPFLITYAVLLVVIGVPLFYMEAAIGQYSGKGPTALGYITPLAKGLTVSMHFVTIVMATYYGVLMAYCVAYITESFRRVLPWGRCYNYWDPGPYCYNLTLQNLINTDGRELSIPAEEYFDCQQFKYITTGFSLIMLVTLVVASFTHDTSFSGLKELFNVNNLQNVYFAEPWTRALGQVFFSMDLATGNAILFGASHPFGSKTLREETAVFTILNLAVPLAYSCIMYNILGYLSEKSNIFFYLVTDTGKGLAFVVFSEVVLKLPFSKFWSVLIFTAFFMVCLHSVIGCIQPSIYSLQHYATHVKHCNVISAACFCGFLFLCGIPCVTGGGKYIITLLDDSAAVGLVFIGVFEILFVFGLYGLHTFIEDINFMLGRSLRCIHFTCIVWLIGPVILGIVCVISILRWQNPRYNFIYFPSWAIFGSFVICLTAVFIIILGAVVQIFNYCSQGALSTILRSTKEWHPADKLLKNARVLFPSFSMPYMIQYINLCKASHAPEEPIDEGLTSPSQTSQVSKLKTVVNLRISDPKILKSFRSRELEYMGTEDFQVSREALSSDTPDLLIKRIYPLSSDDDDTYDSAYGDRNSLQKTE